MSEAAWPTLPQDWPFTKSKLTGYKRLRFNAVSHRNYQLYSSVFVRRYEDRIVIESPGGFPPGITLKIFCSVKLPETGLHTRRRGLDREENKQLILKHLKQFLREPN